MCAFQAPEGCTNCRPEAVNGDVPNVLARWTGRTELPNVPSTTQPQGWVGRGEIGSSSYQFISIIQSSRCQVKCLMSSISQRVSGRPVGWVCSQVIVQSEIGWAISQGLAGFCHLHRLCSLVGSPAGSRVFCRTDCTSFWSCAFQL